MHVRIDPEQVPVILFLKRKEENLSAAQIVNRLLKESETYQIAAAQVEAEGRQAAALAKRR